MKIAVIHRDSRKRISYHETVQEALDMIADYELLDTAQFGASDDYDWEFCSDERD